MAAICTLTFTLTLPLNSHFPHQQCTLLFIAHNHMLSQCCAVIQHSPKRHICDRNWGKTCSHSGQDGWGCCVFFPTTKWLPTCTHTSQHVAPKQGALATHFHPQFPPASVQSISTGGKKNKTFFEIILEWMYFHFLPNFVSSCVFFPKSKWLPTSTDTLPHNHNHQPQKKKKIQSRVDVLPHLSSLGLHLCNFTFTK